MNILNKFLKRINRKLTRSCIFKKIDYFTLQQMIREDSSIILLDVRSEQEYKEGHLLGALNIPLGHIENKVNYIIPNKYQKIIVYCQMGGRSKKAINKLLKKGYTKLYQLDGGLDSI